MAAKRDKVPTTPQPGGFGGLGTLLEAHGLVASTEAPALEATPVEAPRPGRVVLRAERKGRGGKTVTTLTRHGLEAEASDDLARRLRRALGCGATVEGEAIVVQGDQREPAARWLEAQGWRVTQG
ncbi:MAG: translation initiation factor [Pseudomonadota bacterium]